MSPSKITPFSLTPTSPSFHNIPLITLLPPSPTPKLQGHFSTYLLQTFIIVLEKNMMKELYGVGTVTRDRERERESESPEEQVLSSPPSPSPAPGPGPLPLLTFQTYQYSSCKLLLSIKTPTLLTFLSKLPPPPTQPLCPLSHG